jgi:predicted RNA-binding Zn-ribbon protein involved in translation (DUF1610 family)
MPKVNTRFFMCPNCKNSNRFKKKTYTVFIQNEEDDTMPGMVYQNDIEYECVRCGHVVKKETANG